MEELELSDRLSSVPEARHWIGRRCAESGLPAPAQAVAELLTTELVGNAVLHGSGVVRITADVSATGITVRVHDSHPGRPVLRHVGAEATGGRGVALVDALSTRWGTTPETGGAPGKTVWFHLEADSGFPARQTG